MLGAGAMGEVYLARQVRLERQCAVKVLPSILSQSPDFERRFSIEGKALAKLDHPNVVRVLNAGEDGGRHFLEMEYVEGGSLEDMLARSGGRLTEGYTRNALTEILYGLAYAHARNIVHRDLKPANILCPPDGHCKISDFGLALVAGEDYMQSVVRKSIAVSQIAGYGTSPTGGSPSALGKTLSREELERLLGPLGLSSGEAAALVGTPYYMSPEVHSGQPVDGRSDIYAVGVMTYRMLTGRIPLGMPKPPSKLVPGLPIEWDTWVAKCMDPEPEDRFQSAEEALEALPGGGRKSIDGLGEARRRMMVRSTGVVVASLILAAIAASIIVGLTAGDEHDINPKLAADSSAARISADPLELIATDYVTVVVIDKTDGTHLFQGTLAAGERRTVQAYGPVEIRYNNGAGLIVERDGRRMVMGTTGTGRTTIVGPVGREANAPPAGQDEEMRQQMAELERQRQELAVQQAQLDEQRLQAEAERARLKNSVVGRRKLKGHFRTSSDNSRRPIWRRLRRNLSFLTAKHRQAQRRRKEDRGPCRRLICK
jgi:serine/threonine protein kinase